MIEIYKYLNGLSPQMINDIFKLRKNTHNLKNAHLFKSQNPVTKRCGVHCIAYSVSQIWQTSSIEIKVNFAKNFQS